jgi:hypothetical protein
MRKIKHIIVHHSVSAWGDGGVVVGWHTSPKPQGNGWKFPGYHVVICNGYPNYNSWSARKPVASADGRVDRILSEDEVANGCKYANANGLQVCMIGDFDKGLPTENQMKKLIDLLSFWCGKYGLDPAKDIYGHGEMQRKIGKEGYSKTCPGKNVDMNKLCASAAKRDVC